MSESLSWVAGQLWGILIGIVTSLVVYIIVTLIPLQEDARYRTIFYRRKIQKLIFNPTVKVSYTVKTSQLEGKSMDFNTAKQTIEEKLIRDRFVLKGGRGDSTIFNIILGRTEVELTLTPSYITEESGTEELAIDYFQCDFKLMECKYRNFEGHLLDLIQIFRKMESSLENTLGKWSGESLTCETTRLYEFVGVLKDLRISSLSGKIGGLYTVELCENKLTFYGTVEATMASMIKDIVTYYY